MADALRSGRSPLTRVKVQVLSSAPSFFFIFPFVLFKKCLLLYPLFLLAQHIAFGTFYNGRSGKDREDQDCRCIFTIEDFVFRTADFCIIQRIISCIQISV